MTSGWRRELGRIDELGPPPGLFERAKRGSASPAGVRRRIERTHRRAPLLVAVLAIVLFAFLAVLTPQRLASANQLASAPSVVSVDRSVSW